MSDTPSCPTPDGKAITRNPTDQARLDELTPIAQYMANQITFNAVSKEARHMLELNRFNTHQCWKDSAKQPWLMQLFGPDCLSQTITNRQAALLIWTLKVAQNSTWDHKPFLKNCFRPRSATEQHFHAYGKRRYYYDIWSNIHYGYVGKASGFSDAMLLDGAGLEQIASTLLTGTRPVRQGSITGRLRDWDGQKDRKSIQLGIALYQRHMGVLPVKTLLDAILNNQLDTNLPRSK
jgi:hypothetical protein